MHGRKNKPWAWGVAPIVFLVACGGGGGGGVPGTDESGVTGAIADVPVAGQFLADCLSNGEAIINDFVARSPLTGVTGAIPTAEQVLASGDPNPIEVIGGLVPSDVSGNLVPIPAGDAMAMIPTSGLPADLDIVGNAPVSCSDAALPTDELPDPTTVLGLVPVFDDTGNPVSLVLATVGDLQSGGLPSPTSLELPGGTDTLPDPLGSTVTSLLSLLGL